MTICMKTHRKSGIVNVFIELQLFSRLVKGNRNS